MEEESHEGSRVFVILAISLIGLLVLGLLAIGGVFIMRQNMEQQAAAVRPTSTLFIRLPNPTAKSTSTPAFTRTPKPTPRNTAVVVSTGSTGGKEAAISSKQTGQPTVKPSPTRTPVINVRTAGAEVPNTGLGAMPLVALAIVFLGMIFVARRLRTA